MGLRIQNNIAAMTAQRNLGTAFNNLTKSLERLSSGYRINRASDDAAGLAISQGFRADIASFKVASRNTSEAAALLQVAEGGMDQIGNMLTRLKELATQAASSNVGTSERTKINSEGNALLSEIDRIANATKYGSTSLLDGTFGASKTAGTFSGTNADARAYGDLTHIYCSAEGGVNGAIGADLIITSMSSSQLAGTWVFSATDANGNLAMGNGTTTEVIDIGTWTQTAAQTLTFANLGITLTANCGLISAQWSAASVVIKDTGLSNLNVTGATTGVYTFSSDANSITLGNGTVTQQITGFTPGTEKSFNFDALGVTLTVGTTYTANDLDNGVFTVTDSGGSGSTFQIGAKNNADNQISLSISGVAAATLNSGLVTDKLDTQAEAQSMLTAIDSAVSSLSTARGSIGASVNRLGYAAANLATTIENMQAAESVIRDVDMADEMTTFTKNQILMQAGTAMLGQANIVPQSVLSLLS